MKWVLNVGQEAASNLDDVNHLFLTESDLLNATAAMSTTGMTAAILQGLSHIELAVMIGFMMLEKQESEFMNFEMAYAEIEKFKSEFREEKSFHASKSVAIKTFEGLISQGLINLIDPPVDYFTRLTFVPAMLAIDPLEIENGLKDESIPAPPSFKKWGERK